jgi:hypothetical protein
LFEVQTAKDLKMSSSSTTAKIAFEKTSSHAWGWATTNVRATPVQALAYVLDFYKSSSRRSDEIQREMRVINDHNRELYVRRKAPSPFRDRSFYNRQIWQKTGDNSFVVVATPMTSEVHPESADAVRGRFPLAMKVRLTRASAQPERATQLNPQGGFGGPSPDSPSVPLAPPNQTAAGRGSGGRVAPCCQSTPSYLAFRARAAVEG